MPGMHNYKWLLHWKSDSGMRQNHYKLMFIKSKHWAVSSTSSEFTVRFFLLSPLKPTLLCQNWARLEACRMFALLHCTNKVLKGDKKDTAIIQSFSPVALTGFMCLILYKHSKKLINKDKTSTVNTDTFPVLRGAKGGGRRLLLGANLRKALVPLVQSQLWPADGGCSLTAGRGGTSSREPSSSQGLLLTGFKPFNPLASTAPQYEKDSTA